MTNFTKIPNKDVDQDSAVTQPLMTALRDNPIAIAEGDAPAPRVQIAALQGPTAGDTHAISELAQTNTSLSSYVTFATYRIKVAGTIRFRINHKSAIPSYSSGISSNVRILKNGHHQGQWTTQSKGYVARIFDLGVAYNDLIHVQTSISHSFNIFKSFANCRLFSGIQTFRY